MSVFCFLLLICYLFVVMSGYFGDVVWFGWFDLCICDGWIEMIVFDFVLLFGECVIDVSYCVVYLGWINMYYYLFQNLLKGVLVGINVDLQVWFVVVLYLCVVCFMLEFVCIVVWFGFVELLLFGVMICVDYYYLYYVGGMIEIGDLLFDEVVVFGMCFVLCCGGVLQVVGDYLGFVGIVLQFEMFDQMFVDIEWLKVCYYDVGVVLMCCVVVVLMMLIFLLLLDLLLEVVWVVCGMGLWLYLYLFEMICYVDFCCECYGKLFVEFVVECEWFGLDVWFVYFVYFEVSEIVMFVDIGIGCLYCFVSNVWFGSGIVFVLCMVVIGVLVLLGVDGVVLNELGSMMYEVNFVWFVYCVVYGVLVIMIEDVLYWGM